ncbi:hypothetical protein [Hyphomicrobium nitrativorans]|uniref:hypothetical protein n=1 Tax=Hyphomicrobium nitrativorans TaxID=1427356 RepID=UPI0011835845|nr:hypothetical protein [Hyphomicrobium nitrativorans]
MPFSKVLWNAGHNIPDTHCHLIDHQGVPDKVTLIGIHEAAVNGISIGRIGELIPRTTLRTAAGDIAKVSRLYTDVVWKQSGGSRDLIARLLSDAVEHDAECLRRSRIWYEALAALFDEGRQPVRSVDGRPGVADIDVNDPVARRARTQLIGLMQGHDELVRNVIQMYGFVADDLSQRLVLAENRAPVGSTTKRPRTPAMKGSRPVENARTVAVDNRVKVDTTSLQKEARETATALAKAREYCLNRATPQCG